MIYLLRDEYKDDSDDVLAIVETEADESLIHNIKYMWTELEIEGYFVDYLDSELNKKGIKYKILKYKELWL